MHALAAALLVLLTAVVPAGTARAQDQSQSQSQTQSYITPFPAADTYKLVVIGDWLAEGLVGALSETFAPEVRLQIVRKHRPLGGVSRNELDDELRNLDDALGKENANIAIVFTGVGDRISYRAPNGKRWTVGSDEWREEYGRRLDRLLKVLKKRNLAVYVVGQAIQRKSEWNDDIQMMNELMRERAYINGMKFIDVYQGFADEAGNYIAHGPDLTGKIRVLRAGDGTGFTADGSRKLAHFVEKDIKRDLVQAKADRNVPLAGAEAEQRKIAPERAAAAATTIATVTPAAAAPGMASKAGKEAKAWTSTVSPATAATPGAAGERADNSRITLKVAASGGREEVATVEILRPAIPATIIAMVTRRESPDKPSQLGDTVNDQIGGGLTVMSSISSSEGAGGKLKGKPGLTQTAFFRVMVKGERLQPRPGRADDFSWPRRDMVQLAPPPSAPQGQLPARSAPAPAAADRVAPAAKPAPGRAPKG